MATKSTIDMATKETEGAPSTGLSLRQDPERNDFENESVFRRNCLPPRSYFIPDTALSLNGAWDFHMASSPIESPQISDSATVSWGKLNVPGHWQLQGYGKPWYTNIQYPIPVNGNLVGYAQGSRNASEFDVTNQVKLHDANELIVNVYQWSDGTYIEDRDQWWLSGIFGDVHLLAFPSTRIEDYFIQADLDDKYQDASLVVKVDTVATEGAKITVTLSELPENGGGEIAKKQAVTVTGGSTATSGNPNSLVQKFGFRKIELIKGLMTVNGTVIRIRGVNRHEHHPLFGRAVPLEFAKRDLLLMKTHNINAVRFSHQPPHPEVLQLCDELGLWVMGEADLECHGFYDAVANPLDIPSGMTYEERKKLTFGLAAKFTTDNPTWEAAYVDRMRSLIQRDKNHVSIIIWGFGNEAFYGQNFKAMRDYARSTDSTRLLHYEGDIDAETTDMFSYMYPSAGKLMELAKTEGVEADGTYKKPIILCEYGHAMGDGPGLLQDYEDAFKSNDRLQGGFIWEWANHGLWKEDEGYYGYGGDFGDHPNDGNFVLDGLVNSQHDATPGLTEYKKVMQPVILRMKQDLLCIENRYNFIGLDHLVASYRVEAFGNEVSQIDSGSISLPETRPGAENTIQLPQSVSKDYSNISGDVYLTISVQTTSVVAWAPENHEVTFFQHRISTGAGNMPDSGSSTPSTAPQISETVSTWILRSMSIKASEENVSVTSNLFIAPPVLAWGWNCEIQYMITKHGSLQVHAEKLEPSGSFPKHIPRIGFDIRLNKALDGVKWYGLGPGESYPDKAQAQRIGIWELDSVTKLAVPYDFPQENGNRMGTRWLQLQSDTLQGKNLRIHSLGTDRDVSTFSFAASRVCPRVVQTAAHPTDLIEGDSIFLNLDYSVAGVGTAACGPGVRPDHLVKCEEVKFAFQFDIV
ncbi:hypothetical protein NLG97_g2067 [Lecanicillium saksenae]|uniref:Uncharacterized protein n=1 Tax=Lecanicillium saksenae TaxID=468837 RepID=A0ACC1R3Q6_9HYPO|nr:hypothetical protein NLG97_g2067 [Lecanicillium saksenae]